MKMERTEYFETSAYKIQARGITQKKVYNKYSVTDIKGWN
jgi:hypothetical protein